jgi:hypothetical protein
VTAELARVGGPLACAGLAALYVAPTRARRLAGLAAWVLGTLLLAVYLAPHGHRAVLAAAAALGLALAAALAALFVRWPWLFAVAALACAPVRIPVHVGSTTSNLLVPLYGIVAAGALAFLWEELRERRARELGPLALPLAAFVLWTGLSLAWSQDLRQGAIALLFFYVPFGFVALAIARLRPERRFMVALYGQLVVMALAFAAIGVYQWANRDIFWNPKVIVGNAYAPFFRVNSVFYDPSVYGRFLVVAILATLVLALGRMGSRELALGAAAIALLWVGLLFSFSQSSFAALAGGILVAAALTWRRRALVAIAVGAAVLVVAGVATPRPLPARQERDRDRGRASARGRGCRRVQARVRAAAAPEGQGPEERGVARHAGDRGDRDRPARPRAPRLALVRRILGAAAAAIVRVAYRRRRPRRDRRAQPLLQRLLRGSHGLGSLRSRRRSRAP